MEVDKEGRKERGGVNRGRGKGGGIEGRGRREERRWGGSGARGRRGRREGDSALFNIVTRRRLRMMDYANLHIA